MDKQGNMVWQYFNYIDDGIVGNVTEITRLPIEYINLFLNAQTANPKTNGGGNWWFTIKLIGINLYRLKAIILITEYSLKWPLIIFINVFLIRMDSQKFSLFSALFIVFVVGFIVREFKLFPYQVYAEAAKGFESIRVKIRGTAL